MSDLITNITGVVMAGGQSSRMGSDKGLLILKEKPMVQYSIELLSSFFETVIISTNNSEYARFGLTIIPDLYKNCGPLCGLYSVLSKIKTNKVFIISCDMPYVKRETIEKILLYQNVEIAVAAHNDFIEPLCGIYSIDLLDKIKSRIESKNFKMNHFIKYVESKKFVEVSNHQFFNINTPEDLV